MTTISLAKLRINLSDVIKKMVKNNERYIVEKDEIPVGVFMNYHEYKELMEELEDLAMMSDPDVLDRIKEAEADYKAGKTKPFEGLIEELGI